MRFFLMAGLLCLFIGCGSDQIPTYPVRGSVKFVGGAPVRHGAIELESVEHGTTATGTIQHDGSFVLGTYAADDGAVAGNHNAIVVQMVIADGAFKHTVDHGDPVPAKYAEYETSPLNVSVKAVEKNEIALEIVP